MACARPSGPSHMHTPLPFATVPPNSQTGWPPNAVQMHTSDSSSKFIHQASSHGCALGLPQMPPPHQAGTKQVMVQTKTRSSYRTYKHRPTPFVNVLPESQNLRAKLDRLIEAGACCPLSLHSSDALLYTRHQSCFCAHRSRHLPLQAAATAILAALPEQPISLPTIGPPPLTTVDVRWLAGWLAHHRKPHTHMSCGCAMT
mmetsp:Transcript_17933/g.45175  ORF Transcript_17933/g.45175 Transcript_17933/m.45175 type:complete len:201 (-) Transcript_17933:409-1011(-)